MSTLTSLRTDPLPLLSRYRGGHFDTQQEVPLILVTHVLPTSVPFIQALATDFDLVAVLAIPYSYSSAAHAELPDVPVIVPADTTELESELLDRVREQNRIGVPFLVQEIGGYLAPAFRAGEPFENLIGIVEDTRQGHWRYRAVEDELRLPVMSVAESPLKALEHHQIGRAIVFSLEHQIRRHFF